MNWRRTRSGALLAAGSAMVVRTRRRLENFYGLLELAVFPAQLPDLGRFGVRDPGCLSLVDLGLADPLAQRLRAHPQPARDRRDRRPLRRVVPGVLADQPDRLGLRARLVPGAWHRVIILPAEGGAHETRVSSKRLSLCARWRSGAVMSPAAQIRISCRTGSRAAGGGEPGRGPAAAGFGHCRARDAPDAVRARPG